METEKTLGAYTLLAELGAGGMGIVYRGRHTREALAERQGGDVAIKVMHAHIARNPDFRARFETEADLALRVAHPGIVTVHDLIVDGGALALVMELIDGRPLSEIIGADVGPIPWERSLRIFRQLLDAVGYAHSHGVVHRDLKPENVIVNEAGRTKILDFGIAKDADSKKTQGGVAMGTVNYMAPEQFRDAASVDGRADIYALGTTLYEMLAGRLPWEATTTDFDIMTDKARGQIPPPTSFYPWIPAPIEAVVIRAMDVDRDARFASTTEFAQALDEAVKQGASGGSPDEGTSGPPLPRDHHDIPEAVGASATFGLIGERVLRPVEGPRPSDGSSRNLIVSTVAVLLGLGGLALLWLISLPGAEMELPPPRSDPASPASSTPAAPNEAERRAAELEQRINVAEARAAKAEAKLAEESRLTEESRLANEGPRWIILAGTYHLEQEAQARMASLQREGFDASYLWIPDYGSLSGARMFAAVIGPVPYSDLASAQRLLRAFQAIQKEAYGLKLDRWPPRTKLEQGPKLRAPSFPKGSPAFNCAYASTDVEILLCNDAALGSMDKQMADLYFALRRSQTPNAKKQSQAHQTTWLASRNQCARRVNMAGCLQRSYQERISQLTRE